ncbi:DUF6231 family protein [Aquirhabdus parva]|uniref:Uncharacterized protein n=1 Tax=Aquirhabdus parva TaxID=2283318 RepID=A0A345P4Y0_9GAMM|nr:DUF6231 family protein [Aquirhabdus parva]AXI02339.1 hypothetical protein HYN46_05515 [Aquirhabdus parva]
MPSSQLPPQILPLIHRLAEEKPIEHGLLISRELASLKEWSAGWPGEWQQQELWLLTSLPFQQRFDLAVIVLDQAYLDENTFTKLVPNSTLANSPHTTATHVITHGLTHLRDLLARRVLVVAFGDQSAGLRALGFSQIEQIEGWELWQFNILEYKQTPDWLNSRYWANPENWGKYRW